MKTKMTKVPSTRRSFLLRVGLYLFVALAISVVLEQLVALILVPLLERILYNVVVALMYCIWPLLLASTYPVKQHRSLVAFIICLFVASYVLLTYTPIVYLGDWIAWIAVGTFGGGWFDIIMEIPEALLEILVMLGLIKLFGYELPKGLPLLCLKAMIGFLVALFIFLLGSLGLAALVNTAGGGTSTVSALTAIYDEVWTQVFRGLVMFAFVWGLSAPDARINLASLRS